MEMYILLLILFCPISYAWDNTDFEIFDLYEEVNGTFYELLGTVQGAPTSDIRRAYRKLSLQLHPDRNKAEDAEAKFRQLVAVYEILKDKDKREKYDNVLRDGLPTWRQPIYYYRKYRKMGNFEVSVIVVVIATIGHYLTWMVAYLEKRFEMEELLAPIRKRREKKKVKGKLNEEENLHTDDILEKELGFRKPTFWDLLPFVLYRCITGFLKSIPSDVRDTIKRHKEEKERILREEEEAKEAEAAFEAEKAARAKRVKPKKTLRDASEFENEEEYFISGIQQTEGTEDVGVMREKKTKNAEWTEEEYPALAKAMAKFPGGTPGRWNRIAHELGRSSDEVTLKVKEMKESLASNITSGTNSLVRKKKQAVNISDAVMTKAIDTEINKTTFITDTDLYQSQYDIPDDYDEGVSCMDEPETDYSIVTKKTKVKTRPAEEDATTNNESSESTLNDKEPDTWSQVQQKCLEAAIAQFPKSTTDRWTCIARAVPEKMKEQCITRYKLLAEHVKQRKTKQGK